MASKLTATESGETRFERVLGPRRGAGRAAAEGRAAELPIYRYLDLSTSHVTEAEMDALCARSPGAYSPLPVTVPHPHGCFMNVPEHIVDAEEGPARADEYPNVQAVIEFAREHDCSWVNFDQDAGCIEYLPSYDW